MELPAPVILFLAVGNRDCCWGLVSGKPTTCQPSAGGPHGPGPMLAFQYGEGAFGHTPANHFDWHLLALMSFDTASAPLATVQHADGAGCSFALFLCVLEKDKGEKAR